MRNKKALRGLAAILAVVLLLGCSFAYFTDRATTQANGTAGTVAMSMDSNINLLDADGQDIINPGDMRDGSFTVTNEGNKSIDVRTTVVLTTQSNTGYDLTFSGDAATQSEYDLYLRDDVELVDGYGYQPKAGAQPLQVKSIDQDTITYIIPEYSLNGNSAKYDEVETIDGVNAYTNTYDFVLVMKGAAGNEWQNSSVSIDVLVEAKQHENTQAGWEIVAQENVTSGAINQDAVKGENVITENTAVVTYIEVISKDENGEDLNATSTLIEGEKREELLNSLDAAGLAEKDDVDLLIDVKSDDFDGMADTTFDVSEIAQDGDTVVILHYDETAGEWEYIATETVADGKVSGDFSSYSPVAFVVISGDNNVSVEKGDDFIMGASLGDIGYDGCVTSPIATQLMTDRPDIVVFEYDEVNEYYPAVSVENHAGFEGMIRVADVTVFKMNDEGCIGEEVGTYNWTSYEIVSETDSTATVRFICDAIDFAPVNLAPTCGHGSDSATVDSSALTIEDGKLVMTITFNKA